MSAETAVRLPVIDFSNQKLQPGTPEWDLVKVQVREALQEFGCFEALFDEVLALRKAVFGALEELFDLPAETKKLYVPKKPFCGYYRATPRQLVESMGIDGANIDDNIEQGLTAMFWPQGNGRFSKTVLSFTKLASGLEKTIRRMILESFGVEKYMDELMDATNYMLRVLKYEGAQTSEPSLGVNAHNDKDMVTLLYQNDVDGLEIQNKDGEWINVKPSPNSFIVMVGESLSVWLNGRLFAPYHRVMMKGTKTRYSVAMFACPRGGYQVKTPEELVGEKNGMLFKPFDFEEYLEFYPNHRGAVGSDLKAYCSM